MIDRNNFELIFRLSIVLFLLFTFVSAVLLDFTKNLKEKNIILLLIGVILIIKKIYILK